MPSGPRPAIKCEQGVLSWEGMTTTPMNMREAEMNPGHPWAFRCCTIEGTLCSDDAVFEATPVPEPDYTGVLYFALAIAVVYAHRKLR